MSNERHICVVAGTHGDEYRLGARVQYILEREVPGRTYSLVGNPRAVERNVRFVDADLNRIFDGSGSGYEADRAEEIKELFKSEGFTHVIDVHTSPTTSSIVPIVPGECQSKQVNEVINRLPIVRDVVRLPAETRPTSLTGAFGAGGIGLECSRPEDSFEALRIAFGVMQLLEGRRFVRKPRNIYRAIGQIPINVEIDKDGMRDFAYIRELDGYSFVAAPQIYKQLGYGHQGMLLEKVKVKNI